MKKKILGLIMMLTLMLSLSISAMATYSVSVTVDDATSAWYGVTITATSNETDKTQVEIDGQVYYLVEWGGSSVNPSLTVSEIPEGVTSIDVLVDAGSVTYTTNKSVTSTDISSLFSGYTCFDETYLLGIQCIPNSITLCDKTISLPEYYYVLADGVKEATWLTDNGYILDDDGIYRAPVAPTEISNAQELYNFLTNTTAVEGVLVDSFEYDTAEYGYLEVTSEKDLDLQGYTITIPNDVIAKYFPIHIYENGSLTIYNGAFYAGTNTASSDEEWHVDGACGAILVAHASAELYVDDMEFYASVYGSSCICVSEGYMYVEDTAFYTNFCAGLEICDGATAEIGTGCYFEQGYRCTSSAAFYNTAFAASYDGVLTVKASNDDEFKSADYGAYVFSSGGTIDIYGGNWQADVAVLQVDAGQGYGYNDAISTINVYDGIFDGKIGVTTNTDNQAFINLYGGTFSNTGLDYDAFSAYVVDGYVAVANADGSYTVFEAVEGDVLIDGVLDINDVQLILQIATGAVDGTDYDADVNNDNVVNSLDAYEFYTKYVA